MLLRKEQSVHDILLKLVKLCKSHNRHLWHIERMCSNHDGLLSQSWNKEHSALQYCVLKCCVVTVSNRALAQQPGAQIIHQGTRCMLTLIWCDNCTIDVYIETWNAQMLHTDMLYA